MTRTTANCMCFPLAKGIVTILPFLRTLLRMGGPNRIHSVFFVSTYFINNPASKSRKNKHLLSNCPASDSKKIKQFKSQLRRGKWILIVQHLTALLPYNTVFLLAAVFVFRVFFFFSLHNQETKNLFPSQT